MRDRASEKEATINACLPASESRLAVLDSVHDEFVCEDQELKRYPSVKLKVLRKAMQFKVRA